MKHQVLNVDVSSARAVVDTYWMINKVSIAALNRMEAIKEGADESDPMREAMLEGIVGIRRLKQIYERYMIGSLDGSPVWDEYLSKVRGIGAVLAFQVIALVPDWTKHVSSIWAYGGLTPCYWLGVCEKGHKRMYSKEVVPLRPCVAPSAGPGSGTCGAKIVSVEFRNRAPRWERGAIGFWNPRFRTVCWLIARSFELQSPDRSFYRKEYDRFKARELHRVKQGHARNRALRMVAKLFIAHLHEAVNELCFGIKVEPYVLSFLGHQDVSSWRDAVAYDTSVESDGRRVYNRRVGGRA
jgi:hypothetical protein